MLKTIYVHQYDLTSINLFASIWSKTNSCILCCAINDWIYVKLLCKNKLNITYVIIEIAQFIMVMLLLILYEIIAILEQNNCHNNNKVSPLHFATQYRHISIIGNVIVHRNHLVNEKGRERIRISFSLSFYTQWAL